MKDRIKLLMESKHLTQQSFAALLGISTASLSSIFNDRTRPTLNHVEAIKKVFPDLNTDWLIFGIGEMTIANDSDNQKTQSGEGTSSGTFESTGNTSSPTPHQTLDFGQGNNHQPTSLFDYPQQQSVNNTPKNMAQMMVKTIDKPQRKITEIRIFYDDQTWETFVPKK